MKILIAIVSILALAFHLARLCYLKKNMQLHDSWFKIIMEITILVVMPIPFYEYTVEYYVFINEEAEVRSTDFLADYVSGFMLSRLYFLFKVAL